MMMQKIVPCFGSLYDLKTFSAMGWKGKLIGAFSRVWHWLGRAIEKSAQALVTRYRSPAPSPLTESVKTPEVKLSSHVYFPFIESNDLDEKEFKSTEDKYKAGRVNHEKPKAFSASLTDINEPYSEYLAQQISSPRAKRYARGRKSFVVSEDFSPIESETIHENEIRNLHENKPARITEGKVSET